MKMSRRARRMAQHHRKQKNVAPLNLVSLMDIFTILVFFLLVSASPSTSLPSSQDIRLPQSTAKETPGKTPVILVTRQSITLQGRPIMTVAEALAVQDGLMPLLDALRPAGSNRGRGSDDEREATQTKITIMGDADTPYRLLKKILATCAQAHYTQVDLVVSQRKATDG